MRAGSGSRHLWSRASWLDDDGNASQRMRTTDREHFAGFWPRNPPASSLLASDSRAASHASSSSAQLHHDDDDD